MLVLFFKLHLTIFVEDMSTFIALSSSLETGSDRPDVPLVDGDGPANDVGVGGGPVNDVGGGPANDVGGGSDVPSHGLPQNDAAPPPPAAPPDAPADAPPPPNVPPAEVDGDALELAVDPMPPSFEKETVVIFFLAAASPDGVDSLMKAMGSSPAKRVSNSRCFTSASL